jgi:hypothetical protein
MARHFARLRISERIIPATGPVGAGGDAGRDFETYVSHLSSTPIATSTFLSKAADSILVFGCSLMEGIEGKIRSDLKVIFGHGQRVSEVYYFCEASLPVGKRNKLQKFCKDSFGADLTIFDGEALADSLTDIDLFWIAQQFLGVPAEMYPRTASRNEHYENLRAEWLVEGAQPVSFADFAAVKTGLRKATFDSDCKPDLVAWLSVMTSIGANPGYRRRAIYEICVAALRGLNDLSSRKELVVEYFKDIAALEDVVELRDASVLLSYCSSAVVQGHLDMSGSVMHSYSSALVLKLDGRLKERLSTGARCELLQIRGTVESLWFRSGPEPQLDAGGMFSFWRKMLRHIPDSPLFPLEQFADVLTILVTYFAEDARFEEIAKRTDALLEKRSSAHIAAEKCRDRAVELLSNGKVLHAIRQLHTAKVKWFSAETLRGTILSMLVLSDSYLGIGLTYAARHYALGALILAFRAPNEQVRGIVALAVRQNFNVCYASGEWYTCITLAELAFATHNEFESGRYDLDRHKSLAPFFYHWTVLKLLARRFAPAIGAEISKKQKLWPIPPAIQAELDELLNDASEAWPTESASDAQARVERELWGRPFMDVGRTRSVTWRALGISWQCRFENDRDTVAICEELLAALQVILAELALTDLLLLPTSVDLEVNLIPQEDITTDELPGNKGAHWKIGVPRVWSDPENRSVDAPPTIVALASVLLGKCSALSASDFQARMSVALDAGLFNKTMSVRPYSELYCELMDKESFSRDLRHNFEPLFGSNEFHTREAPELSWRDGDAPGYSVKKSEEHIVNRYRRAIRPIRLSLPRLVKDPRVLSLLRGLRSRGIKDWEIILILANLALNYRMKFQNAVTIDDHKRLGEVIMKEEESESSVLIPVDAVTEEEVERCLLLGTGSMWRTWGLHVHRQTPDLQAMRRLLEVRYHVTRDDVPHEPILE